MGCTKFVACSQNAYVCIFTCVAKSLSIGYRQDNRLKACPTLNLLFQANSKVLRIISTSLLIRTSLFLVSAICIKSQATSIPCPGVICLPSKQFKFLEPSGLTFSKRIFFFFVKEQIQYTIDTKIADFVHIFFT